MSWHDGETEDYLFDLGWLEHKPRPPYPRPGHIGEHVYSEDWATLMLTLPRDGINAPNSTLAEMLCALPERITQRHATICASIVTWLGTSCGQGVILNGRRYRDKGIHQPYLLAWHAQNTRSAGVNNGFRIIEHILAPEDHFGIDPLWNLGPRLQRIPDLTVYDYETVELLMTWLDYHGEGFILGCERRIEALTRFEQTKRDSAHRQNIQKLGLTHSQEGQRQ